MIKNDNGWIDLSDTRRLPEGVLQRLFDRVDQVEDINLHIVRACDPSVTDKQIQEIKKYIKTCFAHWCITSKKIGDEYESEVWIFRSTSKSDAPHEKALVRYKLDSFYHEYRITAIRQMNPKTWNVKRTVFKAKSEKQNKMDSSLDTYE